MTGVRYREVAQQLRERIALGEFAASGEMESESALGARYDVSRVTVRRALEELRSQGLVQSRKGAGWFVSGAAYHQQLALGSFRHAESAVAGKQVVREVLEFGYTGAPESITAVLGTGRALYCRSLRLVDGEPLDVADEWVPEELAARISRADAATAGIWRTLQQHGARIDGVRQTITAGLVTDADAESLGAPAGAPLLLVRRLASDVDGRPVALADHRYLAHRFSLDVEFHGWPVAAEDGPPGLRTVP